MKTETIWHAATGMLRHVKIATSAHKGRTLITLLMMLLTTATAGAQTTESVKYIDENGDEQTVTATVLTGSENSLLNNSQTNGWFVVNSNISYTGRRISTGLVNIILKDNYTMTVSYDTDPPFSLRGNVTIYGQSGGTGKLVVNTSNLTAIDGGSYTFTVNGGIVESKSTYNYGRGLICGSLVFNGGKLKLEGCDGVMGRNNTSKTVTLNWRSTTDRVYISGFNNISSVTVGGAGGKYFVDGSGNSYVGTYTSNFSSLAGKELQPATAYTLILGSGITTTTEPLFTNSDVDYYAGTVTLGYSGTVPDGYLFGGYTVNGAAIDGNTFSITADATVAATFAPDPAHFEQTGTDEYTIHTATGWGVFCDALQDNDTWNRFTGKTVKLDANIGTAQDPITRMAGSSKHDFCGTFDGGGNTLTVKYGTSGTPASVQNIAPFSYVSNVENGPAATIRNLHVAGDIYTSAKYAAGIVGQHWGTLNIENCRSSVVIHSSTSGDGTHGGIEGASNGTLNITGCVFDGKLLSKNTGNDATTLCGGFVGYGTCTITNSLYAPAGLGDGETEITNGSCTFVRNATPGTNCYYTRLLGTAQGKAPRTVTAGTDVTIEAISPVGSPVENGTYSVSGITAYAKGITRTVDQTTTFYYGNEDQVSLTLSNTAGEAPLGYQHAYAASAGTLSGTTLTMPAEDVTISNALAPIDWATESTGLDWDHAYMIYNKDQLDLLAQRVNSGTTYENKYFKLGADITYSHTTDWNDATSTENNYTAIGTDNAAFRGRFDGQNHVVSGIRIYKNGTDAANMWQGLFGVLYFESGTAEIKNVILADARITGSLETGGIVGANCGTVSNCHVLSNVNIHAVQNGTGYHGGIAGNNYDGCTITACTSAASITSAAGSGCQFYGGIVGSSYGPVSDCLYLGNTVEGNSSVGAIAGFIDQRTASVTNCYFTSTASSLPNKAVGSGGGNKVTNCGLAPQDNADNSKFLTLMAARNAALTAVSRTEPLSTAVDITLNGRTLYKDGAWNTLCLPFDVSTTSGTLAGDNVKAMTLNTTTSGLSGSTLTLNFDTAPTTIPAGTPFIIKWATKDAPAANLENPVFTGVTIDNSSAAIARKTVDFTGGKFKGIYAPIEWDTENQSILFLGVKGGKSALYYPQPDLTDPNNPVYPGIKAFRAYFQLSDGQQASAFNLNFGDNDDATGIRSLSPDPSPSREGSEEWYSLDGRKLDKQPTAKGVYIHRGRKVVIK